MSDAISRKVLLEWLEVEIDLSSGNDPIQIAERWVLIHVKKAIEKGRFDISAPKYPTPDAYEAACRAVWKWRNEAERLKEEKDKLHSAENWQSIESAPKDGTHILVFCDGHVYESWFENECWRFPRAEYHGCGCCMDCSDSPTHWKPLLDAPEGGR